MRSRRARRRLHGLAAALGPFLLASIVVLAPASPGRARSDAADRELRELQRAIELRRERVAAFEQRQRGLLEALEAIDQLAASLRESARRAERQARAARAERYRLGREVAKLEAELARTRAVMARRVVALYESGPVGPVQVVFAARSLPELLERVELLRWLLTRDARLVTRFREERDALLEARLQLRRQAERLASAQARARRRLAQLEAERRSKRKLLARVRADRARERAVLAELEEAARALEEELERLRERPPAGPPPEPGESFAAQRGRLPPPVDAPVARPFGRVVDSEFYTQVLRKGVEYAPPFGAPVRAVAPGRVRFAGWFRGYGRLLILDHGDDFFTVYAHLDRIAVTVGEAVRAGQRIGSVGETGSLAGPRLYFEIRRGSQALDPSEWLRPPGPG